MRVVVQGVAGDGSGFAGGVEERFGEFVVGGVVVFRLVVFLLVLVWLFVFRLLFFFLSGLCFFHVDILVTDLCQRSAFQLRSTTLGIPYLDCAPIFPAEIALSLQASSQRAPCGLPFLSAHAAMWTRTWCFWRNLRPQMEHGRIIPVTSSHLPWSGCWPRGTLEGITTPLTAARRRASFAFLAARSAFVLA